MRLQMPDGGEVEATSVSEVMYLIYGGGIRRPRLMVKAEAMRQLAPLPERRMVQRRRARHDNEGRRASDRASLDKLIVSATLLRRVSGPTERGTVG